MFTGLVQAVGEVVAAKGHAPRRITIAAQLPGAPVELGESIAIDGCCLTVVESRAHAHTFEAATETLKRTTLGELAQGGRVNLERSLRAGDLLGGHLVSGHIDGVGRVKKREQRDSALYLGLEPPSEIAHLVAARGSVAVAGVSLTVTDAEAGLFWVALIPHTLKVTTLGALAVGSAVNLEADLIARYLERLLAARRA